MPDPTPLSLILKDVDVVAESATFYDRANSDLRRTASLPTDGRIRVPRKPKKDSQIIPSSHRPHVLASDRLLLWTTPHSDSFQKTLENQFPANTVLKLFQVMLCSLDQDTRSNYGAGLLRFTQYCDRNNIPETDRMPASESLLSTFAASAAGHLSDKTLASWLAGLHYWHTVNGAPWHGNDMLHHVRRGFAKLVPPSSKRAKRPPVTVEAMIALRSGLDLTNAFDASVWAIAAIAFWSCCRLGELVIPSVNLFNANKHVSRNILPLQFTFLDDSTTYSSFHIPWTKTTLQVGATLSVTSRNHYTCPIIALKHHLACNVSLPSTSPLFAFETASGTWSPMTKDWFMTRCNDVWIKAGYPDMPGHAFRIGGATELLLQGINPDIVATQGRWKSQAFLEYWRKIESILPLFISSSSNSSRTMNLDKTMDNFRTRHNLTVSS
jgi:hypothetical protein